MERKARRAPIYISIKYLGILSHLIIGTANRLYRIYYQFFANGNFTSTRPLTYTFRSRDSISASSQPEVLRKWLLSHFRTKKKSNERMMDAARKAEGERDWRNGLWGNVLKDRQQGRDKSPLQRSRRTLPTILWNVSRFFPLLPCQSSAKR